jgi:hypothetical protein
VRAGVVAVIDVDAAIRATHEDVNTIGAPGYFDRQNSFYGNRTSEFGA